MPNVTVTPPSVIKVQVGPAANPTVPAINYGAGGVTQLRNLTDVDASNLQDGYGIIYVAATDKFTVEPVASKNIDNGFF